MALESEIVRLVLYATQQLGVTLAVGGQTIVLLAYLISMRDRVVDTKEAQFSRAVKAVLFSGRGLVILSGFGITALHYIGGEFAILFAPAYLFKWLLVALVVVFSFDVGKRLAPPWVGEGIVGGTWYALFLVHILAPVTTWENLLVLYGGWLGAFFLIWIVLVFGTRERKNSPPKPTAPLPPVAPLGAVPNIPSIKARFSTSTNPILAPKLVVTPPPAPVMPPPPPLPPPPAEKPPAITDPDAHPGLPAIRVMPKTPQDIDTQHRASVVKLE